MAYGNNEFMISEHSIQHADFIYCLHDICTLGLVRDNHTIFSLVSSPYVRFW